MHPFKHRARLSLRDLLVNLVVSVVLLCGQPLIAQSYLINQPQINACVGELHDSGGPDFAYQSDEDFTTVICSDVPGGRVSLTFTVFDLSTNGPGVVDALIIHDGNSTDAPLVGTYIWEVLTGLTITATSENPSGCLTVVFRSNGNGVGNFAATIACLPTCLTPTAVFADEGDTLRRCVGDRVPVDGTESTAQGSATVVEWAWIIGNSVPVYNDAAQDTVLFQTGGVHPIRLLVRDDLGCVSDPSEPLIVLVSGPPTFAGTQASGPVCVGDEITLTGAASAAALLPPTQEAGASYGTGIALPDIIGIPIESTTEVSWYPEGATIDDPDQLDGICTVMEHSYMGDLVVTLTCPNGQSVTLHEQGGDGTYLGSPDDYDTSLYPNAGTCWQYCWSPSATLGTMEQYAIIGPTPNVAAAGTPPSAALLPGTYSSVEPLTDLVGCPFNGTWTLTITDLAVLDNGFLCSWDLGFEDAGVDSSYIDLSPRLALDHADSAYWNGAGITAGVMPTQAIASATQPGNTPFTFTVVDTYGCVYDTSLTMTSLALPLVNTGPDVTLCNDPVPLTGSVVEAPFPCTYHLVLVDLYANGWTTGQVSVTTGGNTTTYAAPQGVFADTIPLSVLHGQNIQLNYTPDADNYYDRFLLMGGDFQLVYASQMSPNAGEHFNGTVACPGFITPSTAWSPAVGVADPAEVVTLVTPPAAGWITLTASYPGLTCSVADSLLIEAEGGTVLLSWDPDAALLCAEPALFTTYSWYLDGELQTTTATPCLADPGYGLWSLIASSVFSECPAIAEPLALCPVVALEQNGDVLFTTPELGGTYAWTLNGTPIIGADGPELPLQGNGLYEVTISGGCVVSASLLVNATLVRSTMDATAVCMVVPNPNDGTFQLHLPPSATGVVELRVWDGTGRVVATTHLPIAHDGRTAWHSLQLPSGLYQLQFTAGTPVGQLRMVVR